MLIADSKFISSHGTKTRDNGSDANDNDAYILVIFSYNHINVMLTHTVTIANASTKKCSWNRKVYNTHSITRTCKSWFLLFHLALLSLQFKHQSTIAIWLSDPGSKLSCLINRIKAAVCPELGSKRLVCILSKVRSIDALAAGPGFLCSTVLTINLLCLSVSLFTVQCVGLLTSREQDHVYNLRLMVIWKFW